MSGYYTTELEMKMVYLVKERAELGKIAQKLKQAVFSIDKKHMCCHGKIGTCSKKDITILHFKLGKPITMTAQNRRKKELPLSRAMISVVPKFLFSNNNAMIKNLNTPLSWRLHALQQA